MSYFSGTESRLRPYHFNYPERSLTMEEMLNKFIDEGKQEHEEMRALIYDFQTNNELLFKEWNNSLIELRFGTTIEPVIQPSNEVQTPPVPFPRRLRKEKEEAQHKKFLENLKQLHINLPFIEALAQMPMYAKFLKGLLTNKARLEEACEINMNKRCSAVLLNKLPSKEKDPGSFTIPCDIGQLHIDNALADLGASISLMPYTMYKKHDLEEPKATRMSLELADRYGLPPHEQRYRFLRYEGLEYTDSDIAEFKSMMAMEHRDEAGVVVFTSQAWGRLFSTRGPMVWDLILKFLSTLRFGEEMESLGFIRYWSERMIPGKGDLHDYWRDILTDEDFLGPLPSYTLIRDPILRLCHQMMAYNIARRSHAHEKVTVTDLFYLRGLDVGSVNIPYLLARYLRRFAAWRKSGAHISGGQFVAQLAEHFGLLTVEILEGLTVIAPELQIIDMAELARFHIYIQLDDTWAWVAMGLERQLDAAAGAPEVAQDAPIVDEGGQAVPAPV
ncbi:reverse transcriptase domain-containing protein [Tanacetum coccineum]